MSSQIIGQVDVSQPTGRDTIVINQGWVRFYNHSIFGLQIELGDGQQFYIPPQARRTICVVQPSGDFTWQQIVQLNIASGTQVSTMMVIEAIDPSDTKIENDYALMGGVGNVGNAVVVANQLQNFSSAPATQVISTDCQNNANPNPSNFFMFSDGGGGGGDGGPLAVNYWRVSNDGKFTVSAPDTLLTGHQETGRTGFIASNVTNAQICAITQNFKTQMQNTPTSITLTVANQLNAGSPTANEIDKNGFTLSATMSGANGQQCSWRGSYTTVGN